MQTPAEVEARLDLESEPPMVRTARQFVANTLTRWDLDALVPDAQVIASELVSNGVLHARTSMQVVLRADGRRLRIEVFDQNTRLPLHAPCPEDATSGRGLALVRALSSSWGVAGTADGKLVWAELEIPPDDPEPGPDRSSDVALRLD